MDEQTLKHIFEPYFTTKETGSGTGLGLAAVHGIVDKYNGHIRVKSSPGQGTTFTIFLPVLLDHNGEPAVDLEDLRPPSPDLTPPQRKILIVDDEPSIRKVVLRQLENEGYVVEAFEDGNDAIEAFAKSPQQYSMVITDQTMPNMTGAEMAQKMLKMDSTIPIILCTGHSDVINKKQAKQIGIKEFLYKPVNQSKLLEIVAKYMNYDPL